MDNSVPAPRSVIWPKRAAVENIDVDVDDNFESEISVNIDIIKGDIDPALVIIFGDPSTNLTQLNHYRAYRNNVPLCVVL